MTPEEFVAKHGFPGTPAGDRMLESLYEVVGAAFRGGTEGVVHDPDFERGADDHGDIMYAKCGFRVHLGDLNNWYGATQLINCDGCLKKMGVLDD